MVFLGDKTEQGVWMLRNPIRGKRSVVKPLSITYYGREFGVGHEGPNGWEVNWDGKPTKKEFIRKLKDFRDNWFTRDNEMEEATIFINNADIILNVNEGHIFLDKLFNEHGGY